MRAKTDPHGSDLVQAEVRDHCGYGRAEPVRVEGDVEHKEERPESVRRRKEPVHRVLTESGAWMSM
jgi:hypothetical protein